MCEPVRTLEQRSTLGWLLGMVKFAQVVLGPAGSGKSTYCAELQKHCNDKRRAVHVINLDPVRHALVRPRIVQRFRILD